MPKITVLLKISLILTASPLFEVCAQVEGGDVYSFIKHLDGIGAYDEGLYFIDKKLTEVDGVQKDSLKYWKGYFNYAIKNIPESIAAFESVQPHSSQLYIRSQFWTSFQYAYLGNYEKALRLQELDLSEGTLLQELKFLELSAIALLNRDFSSFDRYSSQFSGSYYRLSPVEQKLMLNKEGLVSTYEKSPLVGGLLSAIVPGAGKFYAEKSGQGYLTFLLSAIMLLQMREAYVNDGFDSFRFKAVSSIFGILYVANIWGTVMAVKVRNQQINSTYDQAILLNMHIPLRTLFD